LHLHILAIGGHHHVDIYVGDGEYVEVQGTAEGRPFDRAALEKLLNLAEKGIGELLAIQKRAL